MAAGSRTLAIVALAAALGVAAGYWIARERPTAPPPRQTRGDVAHDGLALAVQQALTDDDRVRGIGELARLLQAAPPEALPEVRAGFESVFLDAAEIEIVMLAEWWAAFDPKAAFDWAQSSHVANHALVIRSMVRAWARRDPYTARDAVGTLLDPITRRACLDALVAGWEDSGKPGALEFVRETPPSIEQLRALATIARRKVLRDGVEDAFRWVESLPDEDPEKDIGRFKLQLFRRIVSVAATQDPQQAAAFALRHADGPNGDGLLGRVAGAWTMRDGPAAMAWLSMLPEGPARDRAVEDAYRAWLTRNEGAALAWLRDARIEPWLDPAVAIYAVAIARPDPERALSEWAPKIRDAERRRNVVITLGRLWREQAPEAADAWLAQAELEPGVRELILHDAAPGAGAAAYPTGDAAAPDAGSPPPEQP